MSPSPGRPVRPNVIWLVSEDNSPRFVGPYGDPLARTPALDELAASGVVYDSAFATAPVCAPSRFSIITGMYASSFAPANQMRATGPASGSWEGTIPASVRGFPAYLREAGYYCTNNAKEDYNAPLDLADVWDDSSRTAHWRNRPDGAPFFAVFNSGVTHESSIHPGAPGPLPDGVHPDNVQVPAYLPDLPEIRHDLAWYYDQNRRLDDHLAQRLAELDEDGLADDTVVFYYGDHGGVLPRSKRFCYDSGLRVPLVVRVPQKWQHLWPAAPASRVSELVTLMDLGPTVLSLAGIEPPAHMHGRALAGESYEPPPAYVFGLRNRMDERYDFVRTARDSRFRYIRNYLPHLPHGQHLAYLYRAAGMAAFDTAHQAGRISGPPAAFFAERPYEELYDLNSDPDEVTNLAGRPDLNPVLDRMRTALDRHMLSTCDNGFLPEGALQDTAESNDPDKYPLERLMDLAETAARRDPANLPELLEQLTDDHELVRYWAAMGCAMLADLPTTARDPVAALLVDDSPVVRIAAAEALCRAGDTHRAMPVLEGLAVNHDHPRVRLQAVNVLDRVSDVAALSPSTIDHTRQDPHGDVRKVGDHLASLRRPAGASVDHTANP